MINIIEFPNIVTLSMIGIFFGISLLIVWIWALIDCISSDKSTDEKLLWILLIVIFNLIGIILYAILGKKDKNYLQEIQPKNSNSKNKKVLTRDTNNEMVAGVCSGLAKYFDMDVTIVRLIFVLILFITNGSFLLVYLIGAIIIPPEDNSKNKKIKSKKNDVESNVNKTNKKKKNYLAIILIIIFVAIPIVISSIVAIGFVTYSVSDDTKISGPINSIRESIVVVDETKVTIDSISHIIDLVKKQIMDGYNYREHNGYNLIFLQNYRPEQSECTTYMGDPFGMRIYERDCTKLRFRFDVDTDKLPEDVTGFYVEALVIRNEIKEMSFTERS